MDEVVLKTIYRDFRPMLVGNEAPPGDEAGLLAWAGDKENFRRRSAAVTILAERKYVRLSNISNSAAGDAYWQVRMAAAVAELLLPGTLSPANKALLAEDHVYYVQAILKMPPARCSLTAMTPAVESLIRTLEDKNSYARHTVAKVLGETGDARAVEPLITALWDSNSSVREEAAKAFDKLHCSPTGVTEKAYYFIASQDWISVVSLGMPAIEPLNKINGYDNTDVQKHVNAAISKIYSQITEIIFGETSSNNSKTCIKNLETSQLTIPISSLMKITTDADTYDFDMVERFITYSINYVGQKHLRKKVEVHIYGNPDKLHPNLLNSFKNLCRKVSVQEKEA